MMIYFLKNQFYSECTLLKRSKMIIMHVQIRNVITNEVLSLLGIPKQIT